MMTDIQKWLEKLPGIEQKINLIHLLIVEGFLIFNYKWVDKISFSKNSPFHNSNDFV